jgi:CRP-like cAMP-binding protein
MYLAQVNPEQVILKQGVPGHAFYVLLHGKALVKLHKGGTTRTLRELNVGDSFGEISLLDPTLTTTAEVSAVTESLLLRLPVEKFQTFLRLMPELVPEFVKMKEKRLTSDARTLRASVDKMEDIPMSPVAVSVKKTPEIPEVTAPGS